MLGRWHDRCFSRNMHHSHRSASTVSDSNRMLALSFSPVVVIEQLLNTVVPPSDPQERHRFAAIADALVRRDGPSVVAMLEQPAAGQGGIYAELPALVLTVLAVQAFADHGWELPDEAAVLHAIRRQVRTELMRLPLALTGSWLVPHAPRDVTQAHVGALLLARKGDLVRPWMWAGIPERGPFILIGVGAGNNPAVADEHCRGATDFLQLVQRAGMIVDETFMVDAVAG